MEGKVERGEGGGQAANISRVPVTWHMLTSGYIFSHLALTKPCYSRCY